MIHTSLCDLFSCSYFEKHFKSDWRPEMREEPTLSTLALAHQGAASAFLAPSQPPMQLVQSSNKPEQRPMPPAPGPAPTFR
jgi:hypothetical protein